MFRTSLSLLNGEQCSKATKRPSATVPHQVYTVREIIQRSQRGLPINSRPLPFESDVVEPDIDNPENPFIDKIEVIDSVRDYLTRQSKKNKSKAEQKERTEPINGSATEVKPSE